MCAEHGAVYDHKVSRVWCVVCSGTECGVEYGAVYGEEWIGVDRSGAEWCGVVRCGA